MNAADYRSIGCPKIDSNVNYRRLNRQATPAQPVENDLPERAAS